MAMTECKEMVGFGERLDKGRGERGGEIVGILLGATDAHSPSPILFRQKDIFHLGALCK